MIGFNGANENGINSYEIHYLDLETSDGPISYALPNNVKHIRASTAQVGNLVYFFGSKGTFIAI
jgi:hypothetical protein